MLVMKFGRSSVESAKAIQRVADIVREQIVRYQCERHRAVVVSTMALRHGLTSRIAVLPAEDFGAYKTAECRRHRRLLEAKIAHDCNYDREKFRQHIAASA